MGTTTNDTCVCGHAHDAHLHLRRGTDCSLCPARACTRYVRAGSWRARAGALLHRR